MQQVYVPPLNGSSKEERRPPEAAAGDTCGERARQEPLSLCPSFVRPFASALSLSVQRPATAPAASARRCSGVCAVSAEAAAAARMAAEEEVGATMAKRLRPSSA